MPPLPSFVSCSFLHCIYHVGDANHGFSAKLLTLFFTWDVLKTKHDNVHSLIVAGVCALSKSSLLCVVAELMAKVLFILFFGYQYRLNIYKYKVYWYINFSLIDDRA